MGISGLNHMIYVISSSTDLDFKDNLEINNSGKLQESFFLSQNKNFLIILVDAENWGLRFYTG